MQITKVTRFIFDKTKTELDEIRSETRQLLQNINGTGFSYSFAEYTVDMLPTGLVTFQLAFATNGRKSGETAGNGTGVPCYYDPISDNWLTFFDNSIVLD